ncbi:MAG: thioesterase family protein [Rhodopseudomonas sp.]|uniref:acyl-CoA thioesterase n=1 Tax=Rhodopseudomonas sp. TaxID=1078 RepID=UPI0017DE584F|nr:thioesterase family protein [Rhodopseudomonas sp.]NVN87790.1 thioesterase family protein [Rhodopseudomonas sp.]
MTAAPPASLSPDHGLLVHRAAIVDNWVDHNGHMNVAAYLTVFDAAICKFCTQCGIGPDRIGETGKTVFVSQANIVYRHELHLGSPIQVHLRILALGTDRLHVYMTMQDEQHGHLAAANEQLLVCVGIQTRRPAPLSTDVHETFKAIFESQKHLPAPRYAGRAISLRHD